MNGQPGNGEQKRGQAGTGEPLASGQKVVVQPVKGGQLGKFGRRSASAKTAKIVIAPEPRVSLLPPEVLASRRGRRLRGRLFAVGLVVAVLMAAAHFAAAGRAGQAQQEFADAQALTSQLLAQQGQFADLRRVTGAIADTEAARDLGVSTEIDWPGWLRELQGALPEQVTIDSVTLDAASPLTAYSQSALPLQPTRVATVTLSLSAPTIFQVSELLSAVQPLPGYADGKPGLVSRTGTGAYQVELTLHVNASAFVNGSTDGSGG